MKIDYHTHTLISFDNEQSIDELCKACIDKGVKELCITEHIDFNPKDICYGGFNWKKHKSNIDYANDKYPIKVKAGAEFDAAFIYQDHINQTIKQCSFDYILGSCHYCHNKTWFGRSGVGFFSGKTEKESYTEYFYELLKVIKSGYYDGISHFDMIKRGGYDAYGRYNPEEYKDIIAECLSLIIEKDLTLEINSSGLRHNCKEPYPNEWILKLYKDLGGINITYGSDGHSYDQDVYAIDYCYDLLKNIGFKYLVTFSKRKKQFIEY